LVPTAIGAPMIVTGMFFHQICIAELQGWTLEWYGTCFIAYAVAQLVTGFLSGPLVDRFGALRMFPLLLLPRVSGLGILAAFDGVLVCPSYLILAGVTAGAARTVTGAMWAEVYGVAHLGSIRAMVTVFMVFSTALAPVSMCWMLDAGATVLVVAAVWIGYILFSTLLASAARRRTTSVADR
jgi:MFS family permease